MHPNTCRTRIFAIGRWLILAALAALMIASAHAGTVLSLSGSYEVLGKTDQGAYVRVRLDLHLMNRSQTGFRIQRIALWNSSHLSQAETDAAPFAVPPDSTRSTIREFAIPRSNYHRWSHAQSLKLLVAVETPGGRKSVELVELQRLPDGKAN